MPACLGPARGVPARGRRRLAVTLPPPGLPPDPLPGAFAAGEVSGLWSQVTPPGVAAAPELVGEFASAVLAGLFSAGGAAGEWAAAVVAGLWSQVTAAFEWATPPAVGTAAAPELVGSYSSDAGVRGTWSGQDLAGEFRQGGVMAVLDQVLDPVFRGEVRTVRLRGSAESDPTAWQVSLWLMPPDGATPSSVAMAVQNVTGSAPLWYADLVAVLPKALTLAMPAGYVAFQAERDDVGTDRVLATGKIPFKTPKHAL